MEGEGRRPLRWGDAIIGTQELYLERDPRRLIRMNIGENLPTLRNRLISAIADKNEEMVKETLVLMMVVRKCTVAAYRKLAD
jgi:hypothetical protein